MVFIHTVAYLTDLSTNAALKKPHDRYCVFCIDESAGTHLKQHSFSTQLGNLMLAFRANFIEKIHSIRYQQ